MTFTLSRQLNPLLAAHGQPFIHRDLSWLQFNQRVLAEAMDATNPLLERVKFLAISASNLDEFFMIRFASLDRSIALASRAKKEGSEELSRQLSRIRMSLIQQISRLQTKQGEVLLTLSRDLKARGVDLIATIPPRGPLHEIAGRVFSEKVLPQLSELEIFNVKVLQHLKGLELGVIHDQAWCHIPRSIPLAFCEKQDSGRVVICFLDQLLNEFMGDAFKFQGDSAVFRLTRDGDVMMNLEEEDPESIPDVIRSGIGSRELGRPVRLQYFGQVRPEWLQRATSTLKLSESQVFTAPRTLGLSGLWSVVNRMREMLPEQKQLFYPGFKAADPIPRASGKSIFELLRERDFLLHHPYDSFDCFVGFIEEACRDPDVTMIEQTVYRMDAVSPIIAALKSAAATKKVRVVIELRARFDELNNLRLAEELRKAGVEVQFGFGKLKLHAKVALVTRREGEGLRHYTHLSTGNYNATTARAYTDLAILTARPDVGEDARLFFDSVGKGDAAITFKKLVLAPSRLHRKIGSLIESEKQAALAGKPARIFAKVNALVDEGIIQKLYEASQVGVKIDLVVRGACSLIPGIKGLSDNIRVISIVDRFLEHSRIYYFESSKALYLSSADWMPRNFFSRMEIAFPVLDERLYRYLEDVLIPAYLADNRKARELTSKGTWKKREKAGTELPFRCQEFFLDLSNASLQPPPQTGQPGHSGSGGGIGDEGVQPIRTNLDPGSARAPIQAAGSDLGQRTE